MRIGRVHQQEGLGAREIRRTNLLAITDLGPTRLASGIGFLIAQIGAEMMRAVQRAHPATPVIAISGQFRPGLAGSCTTVRALGARQVIAKPFTRDDLLAAVRAVIGPAG